MERIARKAERRTVENDDDEQDFEFVGNGQGQPDEQAR